MDKETTELIIGKLELLAGKLGTTAEGLWTILVKQAYIGAMSDVIIISITLAVAIALLSFFRYWWNAMNKEDRDDRWDDDGDVPCIVLTIIISVVSLPIIGGCAIGIFERLYNPEYFALKEILESFN